jgi:glutamate/aspartate transport system substrate-binding protein
MPLTYASKLMLSAAVVGGIAVASPASYAASPTLDKIRSSGTLTLGYREASVPFSYLGAGQQPVGFSLDLCAAVVEQVKSALTLPDLKIAYASVNASNRIPLIQNGTIDIECGSTTNTAERAKQVAFSVTTFVSQPRWLVSAASGIADANGLAGKTVVLTQGSQSLPIAEAIDGKEKIGFHIQQAKDHGESLLMLRTGRASGWFEEDILVAGLRAMQPNPNSFRLLPNTYGVAYRDGLMMPKGDAEFAALVNGVIEAKMKSGEFAKLYSKWFDAPIPPGSQNLGLPMSDALKALVEHPSDAPGS